MNRRREEGRRRTVSSAGALTLFAVLLSLSFAGAGLSVWISGCATNAGRAADGSLLGLYAFSYADEMASKVPLAERQQVRHYKVSVFWSIVEGSDGVFDWTYYDKDISAILADGAESILLLLTGPVPGWAQDPAYGENAAQAPPGDLSRWYRFCAEAARHYGHLVDFYEVWNEPGWDRDSAACLQLQVVHFGGHVETEYLPLLQLAHAAIEENDPGAKVICGALLYGLDHPNPYAGTELYSLLFDDVNRPGQDVSLKVTSSREIVAERITQSRDGMTEVDESAAVEATPKTEWYFREGHVGSSIQEYLYLDNPHDEAVEAEITFTMAKGEIFTRRVNLPAGSSTDLDINRFIGFQGSSDMVAVHPIKAPSVWGTHYSAVVQAIRDEGADHEVVCTEVGWPHHSDAYPAYYSEAGQAADLGDAGIGGLMDNGCRKIWIFRDLDESPGTSWDKLYYGLFDHLGNPHPVWESYKSWQSQLPDYPKLPGSI